MWYATAWVNSIVAASAAFVAIVGADYLKEILRIKTEEPWKGFRQTWRIHSLQK